MSAEPARRNAALSASRRRAEQPGVPDLAWPRVLSPQPPARLYVVVTWVPRAVLVTVGSLGEVAFARGWYAYIGSARRAREARVARHLRADKPLRWHADCLFSRYPATRAWLVDLLAPALFAPAGGPRSAGRPAAAPFAGAAGSGLAAECALVEALLSQAAADVAAGGAGPPAAASTAAPTRALPPSLTAVRRVCPGFGSSDCGCAGHLLAVRRPVAFWPVLARAAHTLGGRARRFSPVPSAADSSPRPRVTRAG